MLTVDSKAPPFLLHSVWLLLPLVGTFHFTTIAARSQQTSLYLSYPLTNHQTTASQIFLIGTAPPQGTVLINGTAIARNSAGHFAPSLPLQLGVNRFTLRYGKQELSLTVNRLPTTPSLPTQGFAPGSLTPAVNIARLPDEWLCFEAVAPPGAAVTVKLAGQTVPLASPRQATLPDNAAVLTQQNQPLANPTGTYRGCARTVLLGDLGQPEFQLSLNGQSTSQSAPGTIRILSPAQLEVAEVIAPSGAARTGPSTDYSRLTPLPKGTRAGVTGYEGEWVRLDYGAWINRQEVQIQKDTVPPKSLIRSITARKIEGWTEIVFPLQVPVPISVQQGDRSFTLTVYNTTAQTDIIKLDDDPLIARLDWQQAVPGQVQYTFQLKTDQQWGYKLRYEGTSLVLALRHPPRLKSSALGSNLKAPDALVGTTVLLDPGHGGPEDLGTRGPTGFAEKTATLKLAQLVRTQLEQRGARVVLTRAQDEDVSLQNRVTRINTAQPTIALSLHYNALPDSGNALQTQGIGTFWYNAQAHGLAVFLHNYLTRTLNRPSYGIFWNNLALTRPTVAPAVLLELGFMINPDEYEWIVNPREQQRLAGAIADGIVAWFRASLRR